MLNSKDFFLDFQNKMYNHYGYALDKLNPSKRFWNYNKISGCKEFRNTFTHNYYIEYAKELEPKRLTIKKVLEIGVYKGHSMLLWNSYFENADIYGIDIDLQQKHLGKTPIDICKGKQRIKLKEFNACDKKELEKVKKEGWFGKEKFDLIIDDGSHHPVHQAQALNMYLPMLKESGTYIVEDVIDRSTKLNLLALDRIENIFNLFENKRYVFEQYVEEQKNELLKDYRVKVIPPYKEAIDFNDINLEGNNTTTQGTNQYKLIIIDKI